MILECKACGKMFKVKDKAASVPRNCTKCGGELRAAGSSPTQGSREKELETRIKELEEKLQAEQKASGGDVDDRLESLRGDILEAEQKARESERQCTDLRTHLEREKAERTRLET